MTGKRTYLVVCALVLLCAWSANAEPEKRPPRKGPKLIVLLVVDQMRTDYIEKYQQQWTAGLHRLLQEGAWFQQAAYPYLNTVTCTGHATIATGTFPERHGMILNGWWDRDTGKQVSCTEDPLAKLVSYGEEAGGGASARWLRVPTLADALRKQLGPRDARVVSLSIKARSAIMMAGQHASAVTWFSAGRGAWVSSSAYTTFGVSFIRSFVAKHPVDKDFSQVWTRALPESSYLYSDDAPGEKSGVAGWSVTFPHPLKGRSEKPDAGFYAAWETSPFADAYLAEMAKASVDALKLGQGRGTDLLAVGFSALDSVGHRFGPRSHEVQDTLVRLDATIGALLEHLDHAVGAGNYVVALSSDHGVATIPEQALAEGADAGRVPSSEVVDQLEMAVQRFLGNSRHVARGLYTDYYFAPGVYEKLLANPAAMEAVTSAALKVPGVWRVFRGDQLAGRKASEDPVERAAALSYFPGRSGDLIVVPKPNWFFVPNAGDEGAAPATHGTAHWYDARVPIILWGRGIRPGQYTQSATPADIAPTLAHLCHITMPTAEGRVLAEALSLATGRDE